MQGWLKKFIRKTDGAVTVEWVTLSAAVIGLGMLVLWPVAFSTESSTRGVADYIESIDVGYDR